MRHAGPHGGCTQEQSKAEGTAGKEAGLRRSYRRVGYPSVPKGEVNNFTGCQEGETR